MRSHDIELVWKTPLLMHADNIDWADEMDAWKDNAQNKKGSKAGDDRSPAWRWLGAIYHNGSVVAMPADNIMRSLMEGGALVPVPGGKNGKTFKSQSQSGMMVDGSHWPLLINGAPIAVAPILALRAEKDFAQHRAFVQTLGFELFLKRAAIPPKKHVRVRPLFPAGCTARGRIHVWDEKITKAVLQEIFTQAGLYKGLGDWRPGGKTPGPYGMFTATVE